MDYTLAFNAFAGQLVNHFIAANSTGNFFISPISISTCLGLLLLGCRNNSSSQLLNVLKFKTNEDTTAIDTASIYKSYQELLSNFNSANSKDQVNLVNKVLIHPETNVLPEFVKQLQSYFMANIDNLNDTSFADVNEWISNSTNGKITSILDGPPDPMTRLLLLNAIYFKGNWMNQFSEEQTEEGFFMANGDSNNKKPVKLMHLLKTKLNYSEFIFSDDKIGLQAVELPYSGSNSMLIFLPVEGQNVDSLVAPGPESLISLIQNFDSSKKRQEVLVSIPKFKFETEYDLTPTLAELGASDLVTEGVADLSGIDGSKNLYVSEMKHKAAIEVNEEGSQAAAASSITVSMRSFSFVTEFFADRPFLFVIRDRISNLILFVGKFTEP